MSEKRRALGRGLGALIPSSSGSERPTDVFFGPDAHQGTSSVTAVATSTTDATDAADATEATDAAPAQGASDTGAVAGGSTGGGSAGDASDASPASTAAADRSDRDDSGLAPVPGATFAELPLDAIRPNPRQPRTVFDEDDMAELVHSIQEIGVLQPIVVRPIPIADREAAGAEDPEGSKGPDDGVRFELIMGERRWRASRAAGKESVPAIIKATEEDDLLRDALLENLHRSQLNALEEAAAYQQLLDDFGCTQEELATRIGRSRPQISNTLRLLKLPPLVARRVAAGVLSAGHARALLSLPDGGAMERLAQRIVAEGLSVRSVEEIVSLGGDQEKVTRRRPRAGGRRPQLDDLAAELSDHLETRVLIALGQRKGKVTVEFASVEDLHRIAAAMGLKDRA